jgi:hypothetical protein
MDPTGNLTPQKEGWKAVFLAEFAATGNVSAAARKAGIARPYAYEARNNDAIFAAAWEDAREIAADAAELELRRRAIEGTLRPVFFRGEECGQIREYSDVLLMFMLKGLRPHVYRDNAHVTHAGDPAAPMKHEHVVTVTDRINALSAAFEGVADRASQGHPASHGAGKPVDS